LLTGSSQIRGALKPRAKAPAKAAQKKFKKFEKKLATAVGIRLDRALGDKWGLSSVQKKMKKKLVRLQKVS